MARKVKIFALSTCGWCKRTVDWLEQHNIGYEKVYVDLSVGKERERLVSEVKKYNPKTTFPTVVIDGGKTVIIGYKPELLEKELL